MVAPSERELANLESNRKPRQTTITAPEESESPSSEAIYPTVYQEDMKPLTSGFLSQEAQSRLEKAFTLANGKF